MLNRITSQLAFALVAAAPTLCFAQSHLMRYADVYEDSIVFTYEGDLWLASTAGGDARRITNDPGDETWPRFSPDGSLIAFTGQYDGGNDVYVMETRGGIPKRLTWHPARDLVLGWFPDGKHVLFRSRRDFHRRTEVPYKVSIDGGMPIRLPVDRGGLAAISPDGTKIAYNRITREAATWKRHEGGTAQDVWIGDLQTGAFSRITNWEGSDNFPMWHGSDVCFNSDRKHGTLNLYKCDTKTGETTALTDYKTYDVKNPSIGPNAIVFQHGEELHLLNLKSGQVRKVPIRIPTDSVRMRPEFVDVAPRVGSFGLSPGGERAILEARGEILNLPVEHGEPINLTDTTASREKNTTWSPDGRWVAFLSDKTGEEEVYLVDQTGSKPWRQVTSDGLGFRMQPLWSPDSKWLVFSDKFLRLNLVNVESGTIAIVDRGEYDDGWERWGIQDYVFSPDSKWIAYTKLGESGTESIFLYSLDAQKVTRVTDAIHSDWSPSFDPGGKYLYFLSGRSFSPVMGAIDQNFVMLDVARPYLAVLSADTPSPYAPKDSSVEVAKDDAGEADEVDEKKEAEDNSEVKPVKIDLEGLAKRIIPAKAVGRGNYFRLTATDDGFLYMSREEPFFIKYQNVNDHTTERMKLYHYNLEDDEKTPIIDDIANYHLSADRQKMIYRSGTTYGVVDTGKPADVGDGKLALGDAKILVDRRQEFMQMFNEAWRIERDFFYDPNMHGLDWAAIGEKYRKFVPDCGNRSDLNYLIGEMIGELNAGHTYVWGGDIARDAKHVSTGFLGIRLRAEPGADYYRIDHIYPGRSWDPDEYSPLTDVGCPIKEGDYLIAINGKELTTRDNLYRHLQNETGHVVTITYNDQPSPAGAKMHRARTIRSEYSLQYRDWVTHNRAKVDELSGGQIGYVHLPNMGEACLIEFTRQWFPQHYKKGFIIDERYNDGGFTSGMIIDRLERKLFYVTKPRVGKPLPEPERAFFGHKIVIVNEDTASSGEWFAKAIQTRGLAPVLGVRTWGGVVGIEPHQQLVDRGTVTPPQFAPYGLDGKWIVEGHGIDPDIEVMNEPGDVIKGKDAQLERAVKFLMARIKQDPRSLPAVPAYPDKSKSAE